MTNSKNSSLNAIIIFLTITLILSAIVYVLTLNAGTTGPFGNRIYGYGIMPGTCCLYYLQNIGA